MIVLDTSAILAVLEREPEAEGFIRKMADAPGCLVSAATLVEAGIVTLARRGPAGSHFLSALLVRAGVHTVEVDDEQAQVAVEAYQRYGKGRHPAGLNFGDCFSYALARAKGAALLYKGDDFSQTDVQRAGDE